MDIQPLLKIAGGAGHQRFEYEVLRTYTTIELTEEDESELSFNTEPHQH
jgi:hypothetical protein